MDNDKLQENLDESTRREKVQVEADPNSALPKTQLPKTAKPQEDPDGTRYPEKYAYGGARTVDKPTYERPNNDKRTRPERGKKEGAGGGGLKPYGKPHKRRITLGPSTQLICAEDLADKLGMTYNSTCRTCEMLQVPPLHIGNTRYYNEVVLERVFHVLTQIGQGGTAFPGSQWKQSSRKTREKDRKIPEHLKTRIDVSDDIIVRANSPETLVEMQMGKADPSTKVLKEIVKTAYSPKTKQAKEAKQTKQTKQKKKPKKKTKKKPKKNAENAESAENAKEEK